MYYALNILFFPFIFLINIPTLLLFPDEFLTINKYQFFYFFIGNIVSFYFYYKRYKIIQNRIGDFGEFTGLIDGLSFILSIFLVAILSYILLNLFINGKTLDGYYAFLFVWSIIGGLLGLILLFMFYIWAFIPVFRKNPLLRIIISIIIVVSFGIYLFIN